MTGEGITLRHAEGVYILRVATVANAQHAWAVSAKLKEAVALWRADKSSEPFFRHRIDIADLVHEGAPLDLVALHPDYREGKFEHPYIVDSLQPGWFWRHTASLPDGADVVRDWLEFVRRTCEDAAQNYQDLWESDTGLGFGASAVLPLVLEDPAWLEEYAAMLAHWDLGHEVHEVTAINFLYDKYGWSQGMRALLIARVAADGQHQTAQVFADFRPKLESDLSAEEFMAFYRDALAAFREAMLQFLDWPLSDISKKTFSIDGPLVAIADALPPNTVEKK